MQLRDMKLNASTIGGILAASVAAITLAATTLPAGANSDTPEPITVELLTPRPNEYGREENGYCNDESACIDPAQEAARIQHHGDLGTPQPWRMATRTTGGRLLQSARRVGSVQLWHSAICLDDSTPVEFLSST